MGFKYLEIIMFLSVMYRHGHMGPTLGLRERGLKRIGLLREGNLFRRKFKDDISTVADVIEQELSGGACHLGYSPTVLYAPEIASLHRMPWLPTAMENGLKYLDPNGVLSHQRRRLERRDYNGKVSNYLWHIDGWDKLKQYGFCIHGCIDGFSRRIMWLDVAASNNDPCHICTNFVDTVVSLGGIPYVIRADRGTENGNIEMMQT